MQSSILKSLLATILLISATSVQAVMLGYNVNIVAAETNADFGTGVTAGDEFVGMMFFDDQDPFFDPEGTWNRSNQSAADMLNIAGVDFGDYLDNDTWEVVFAGGELQCIGDSDFDGCGDGDSSVVISRVRFAALAFFDDFTGFAGDDESDQFAFTYTVSPKQIPEPTTLALMGLGIAGLGFRRKTQ